MEGDQLEKREERILNFLKQKKTWLIYLVLAIIIYFGMHIRTRNLQFLQGKFPLALDPYAVLRYSQYVLEHGSLMANDLMRYYPVGFANPSLEFGFISHFIVYMHKIMNFFIPSLTINQSVIIYPVIAFGIGSIFFFLLVKRLFDWRIALLASAFLVTIPSYLYRTMAGFSDKEALAMMLMFMIFYFYVVGWQSKNNKKAFIFGAIAGLLTACMGYAWGGVNFVFLIIGVFVLVEILLKKFEEKDFFVYSGWIIFMLIILWGFGSKYHFDDLISSFTSGVMLFAFIMGLVDYFLFKKDLLKIRERVREKVPLGIAGFIFSFVFLFIVLSIMFGPNFIFDKFSGVYSDMLYPLRDRWSFTVAESHEPYIKDWFGQMGGWYIWLFIIGSIALFYEVIKKLEKYKKGLLIVFAAFILAFIFSRYSPNHPILNGNTGLANFMYFGSLIIFIIIIGVFYLYLFYKKKEIYNTLIKFDKKYTFVLIWTIVMIMAARRAVRLIFVFSPITTIIVAYLIITIVFWLISYIRKARDKFYRNVGYIALILFVLTIIWPLGTVAGFNKIPVVDRDGTLISFAKTSIGQASATGPSYNGQWQQAGEWARNNLEDAVFAHWWDYGYWVQTGFGFPSITDGGNAMGSWNYFVGRHLITAQSEDEALEFLKSHNVTHVLMISDEIGKYGAFSSIGSDRNYDRYSWISTFNLDAPKTQETRTGINYIYTGGWIFDDDFIYNGQLFPRQGAGIVGFIVPIETGNQSIQIKRPEAVVAHNNKQINVPLNCIFFNNQEIVFGDEGLGGCLIIIPKIEFGGQANLMGAALYVSEKVRRTLFTHLYLYSERSDNFKVVYNDADKMPLAVYGGRLIGPLKIWEVNYPSYIKPNPIYLKTSYPDPEVTKV